MLKKFILLSLVAVTTQAFTYEPSYTFDENEARQELLSLLTVSKSTPMVLDPAPPKGSAEEKFLHFYRDDILPVYNQISQVLVPYFVYDQLVDAGLYKNEKEKETWNQLKDKAYAEYLTFSTDPNWEQAQLELGRLAEGLSGELAEVARMNAKALVFNQSPPELKSLIEEMQTLNNQIDDIANTSPKKMTFQTNSPVISQTLSDYFDGELSFEAASTQLETLYLEGVYAYGKDVFETGADELNRIAEIRSIVAKKKGFSNHAELQVAAQSVAHAEGFKTKVDLLKFLRGLLEETQPVVDRYYSLMARSKGIEDLGQLTPFQNSLLGFPTFLLMRDYYQRERFNDIWIGTMLESGFTQEVLEQVIVDAFPRENKNSHAYMRPLQYPTPSVLKINGQVLNPVQLPETEWLPSLIYILQNYDDDGLGDLSTAFHEGGHALDYSFQRDELGYPSAYGYTETHSTSMESFITDPEFLMAHGYTKEGGRITSDRVGLFIKRKQVSDLLGFRSNVENAIFDILLWDYDYEKGPLSFTQSAEKIADELDQEYSSIKWPKTLVDTKPVHANFVTSHYRSGSVRYFGYVLAEVSAALVTEALMDRLEERTGRRSLYQQPLIAPILTESLYREGFKPAFPESIEEFSGKEFSPKNFTDGLIEDVTQFLDELEQSKEKPQLKKAL